MSHADHGDGLVPVEDDRGEDDIAVGRIGKPLGQTFAAFATRFEGLLIFARGELVWSAEVKFGLQVPSGLVEGDEGVEERLEECRGFEGWLKTEVAATGLSLDEEASSMCHR
jgi:hypothetical protein